MATCACSKNAEGFKMMTDYTPKHEVVKIDSISCYVATPSGAAKGGIIMFTDMFGLETGRHKMLCDHFADLGYLTICPDFIADKPYIKNPPKFGFSAGLLLTFLCGVMCGGFSKTTKVYKWDLKMEKIVMDMVIPFMAEKGVKSLASIGFCWGAYGAMKCAAYPAVFKCAIAFHPSVEGFCKDVKEDDLAVCRGIQCPVLVTSTKLESKKWRPDGEAHKAMLDAQPGKVTFLFEDKAMHGYMTRGDSQKDPEVLRALTTGLENVQKILAETLV